MYSNILLIKSSRNNFIFYLHLPDYVFHESPKEFWKIAQPFNCRIIAKLHICRVVNSYTVGKNGGGLEHVNTNLRFFQNNNGFENLCKYVVWLNTAIKRLSDCRK